VNQGKKAGKDPVLQKHCLTTKQTAPDQLYGTWKKLKKHPLNRNVILNNIKEQLFNCLLLLADMEQTDTTSVFNLIISEKISSGSRVFLIFYNEQFQTNFLFMKFRFFQLCVSSSNHHNPNR